MGVLQEHFNKLDGFYTKVLESMESKKKTPYELDLEVMDRRPDITPKVGDWVKIKSKEWYEKWKDSSGTVNVRLAFTGDMKEHCGRIYKVTCTPSIVTFYLDGIGYMWSMEMFEQVYPQEEYTVHKTAFGEIVIPKVKGSTAMEAIQSEKEQFLSDILPKDDTLQRELQLLKKQAFPKDMTATIPSIDELIKTGGMSCVASDDLVLRTQTIHDVGVKTLSKPETKLRIIKTNQLIKIEKL